MAVQHKWLAVLIGVETQLSKKQDINQGFVDKSRLYIQQLYRQNMTLTVAGGHRASIFLRFGA